MHRRARRLALIGAVVATLALAAPVGAITNGQPDNAEHPQVGELLFYVPSELDDRFTDGGLLVQLLGHADQPDRRPDRGPLHVRYRPRTATTRAGGGSAATTSG